MKSLLILLSLFYCAIGISQKHSVLDCDFTMIEKKEDGEKNSLIMGHVIYNDDDNTAKFNIQFPEKEEWLLIDSTLTKFKNDTLFSEQTIGAISENFIFRSILKPSENDFGLKAVGFEIQDVAEQNGTIIITWTAPNSLKTIIKEAESRIEDNLLRSVTFIDQEGKVINQTFYEKYETINAMPIPVHISTRFKFKEKTLIKILKLKNVTIK